MPSHQQAEKRRRRLLKSAYIAAVLASATACTVSQAQTTKEWDGSSSGNFNTTNNWTASGVPGTTDQASFGNIGTDENVVTVTADSQVDRIRFVAGANAQAFNLRINDSTTLDVHGNSEFGAGSLGVDNASGYTQSFSLMGADSELNFNGASTLRNSGDNSQILINNLAGGNVDFNENSSAGDAAVSITNSTGGETTFNDNANAGYATITNNVGGVTSFNDDSDAYSATIINNTGGNIIFSGDASADKGLDNIRTTITNSGTWIFEDSAVTRFTGNSTAGEARITNYDYGDTYFEGDSDAGTARIINDGGQTIFNDDSSANEAFIINRGGGNTDFRGNSTAENAFIINDASGGTSFGGNSTTGNVTIVNRPNGHTYFNGDLVGDVSTGTIINLTGGRIFIHADAVTLGHVRGGGEIILNGSLTLDPTNAANPNRNNIISGVIHGIGGLTKEGENIVRLTGDNTYLGDTFVNNGVLSLPGSITSNTTINSGGELRGNGTITGNLTNNGGRVVGGDAFGGDTYSSLYVTGTFDSTNANSTTVSRVSTDHGMPISNWIYSTGTAQLGGDVEVQVDQTPGTIYYVNNWFGVVYSDTARTGTFSGVDLANSDIPDYLELTEDAANGINGGLSYDDNAAYIHLRRNTLDDLIDGVNLTRNQRAVYNALNVDDFGDLNDDQEWVIDEFIHSTAHVGSAASASLLSGDALTAFPVAAQGAATRFNQRILSQVANGTKQSEEDYAAANRTPRLVYNGTRFSSLLAQSDAAAKTEAQAAAAARRSSIWATIARAKEDTDSDGNGPGFDTRATEYQVGYNRNISDRTVAGISIGKSDADITIDDRSSKGDLDTTSIAAYFRHDTDDLYFSGLLSYSRHNIDSRRSPNPFDTVTADYDARTIGLWGEVGKKMERGSLKIEPHLSLKLSNTKQDAFSEDGFGGLDVNAEKYNTRRLGLGVRVVSNSATSKFRPYGFVGYEREFGDEQAELTSSVAGLSSFSVKGSQLGKNIWALRLGTDARISDRFSVVGEIGASWRKNQDSRYVYGGVKYGW